MAAPRDDGREIRCFVAVALDAPARAAAAVATRVLRDAPGGDAVRWVREEALQALRLGVDLGEHRTRPAEASPRPGRPRASRAEGTLGGAIEESPGCKSAPRLHRSGRATKHPD